MCGKSNKTISRGNGESKENGEKINSGSLSDLFGDGLERLSQGHSEVNKNLVFKIRAAFCNATFNVTIKCGREGGLKNQTSVCPGGYQKHNKPVSTKRDCLSVVKL